MLAPVAEGQEREPSGPNTQIGKRREWKKKNPDRHELGREM